MRELIVSSRMAPAERRRSWRRDAGAPPSSGRRPNTAVVWGGRVGILAILLIGWSTLPANTTLRAWFPVFDEFFLSSPSRVITELRTLLVDGELEFWANLSFTLKGVSLGFVVGLAGAVVVAVVLTNSPFLRAAATPILDLINAIPTIVLIPMIVLMFGPSLATSLVIAGLSVFFFSVFTAYGGGASMPADMEYNARMLGATKAEIMWRFRFRYVIAWTVQILPGAIGHALTAAFAAELFSGSPGLGRLVIRSILSLDSDLVFATVLILSTLGLFFSLVSNQLSKRYLHWFGKEG